MLGLSIAFAYANNVQTRDLIVQVKQLSQDNKTLSEQNKVLAEQTDKNIEDLRETILCIGTFFSRTDRANLKIETYNPCLISDSKSGETFTYTPSSTQQGQQINPSTAQAESQAKPGSRSGDNSQSPSNNPPTTPNNTPQPPENERGILQRILDRLTSLI